MFLGFFLNNFFEKPFTAGCGVEAEVRAVVLEVARYEWMTARCHVKTTTYLRLKKSSFELRDAVTLCFFFSFFLLSFLLVLRVPDCPSTAGWEAWLWWMRRSEGPRSLNDAFRSAGLEHVDRCAPHGVAYAQKDRKKKKTQQNAASYQDTALKKKNWLTEWPYRYELLIQVDNHTRYRKNTKIKDW